MTHLTAMGAILDEDVSALRLLDKRARELGYAKGIIQDLLSALEAPEDVRDKLVAYAKTRAAHALNGRLM